MSTFKALNKQIFSSDSFYITPIRNEDKFKIMKWRNEQIYHLRQSEPITIENQKIYFEKVINPSFNEQQPKQMLFSFMKNDKCIGYGGLVHINWVDENAEISFIIETKLEKDFFEFFWLKYLELIEDLGFNELKFKKLYVYAFDLRPHLYDILEKKQYFLDARLKNHCKIHNKFKDVVIYSKIKL